MGNEYFSESEMKCPCCGWFVEDPEFLGMLTIARVHAGIPFPINSWCRCTKHDKEIKGEGNHTTGKAVDIRYSAPSERARIVFALVHAGFQRIGVDFKRGFIHADNNLQERPYPALWTY
jgi:zinc D-Ala-D-Ala carboxypeptidase